MKVRITEIGSYDAYYSSREKYVGRVGEFDGDASRATILVHNPNGKWRSGWFVFDDGDAKTFYMVKVSPLEANL